MTAETAALALAALWLVVRLSRPLRHWLRARRRRHLSVAYKAHINSAAWRKTRRGALDRAGHRCERCGGTNRLQVHHLTYARFGHEAPEDLLVLCDRHHRQAHRRRLVRRPPSWTRR
jgi:hypothetical protein